MASSLSDDESDVRLVTKSLKIQNKITKQNTTWLQSGTTSNATRQLYCLMKYEMRLYARLDLKHACQTSIKPN